MFKNENEMRSYIFENYQDSFHTLIAGARPAVTWNRDAFPPISHLIQRHTEEKINSLVAEFETLELQAEELQLIRQWDTTTRIDLFGMNREFYGACIIELKKSQQTERQAYTELLAYASHFCHLFPGLSEANLTSVLVAPMEGRGVRDAYFQEVVISNKRQVALIPDFSAPELSLKVFYPGEDYYRWFENLLFDDDSFLTVVASFPVVDGWIDTDINSEGSPPNYTVHTLNSISQTIAQVLEQNGFHGMVYARQLWGEVASCFPNPNSFVVTVMNPFSPSRHYVHDGDVYGPGNPERFQDIQGILNQLRDSDDFISDLSNCVHGQIIKIVQDALGFAFMNNDNERVPIEISMPHWGTFKESMLEAVTCHNLQIFMTGMISQVYRDYISHIYPEGFDDIYYADDLPKFAYDTIDKFLPVWEIIRGLSAGPDDEL